jgi:hypothetical protein
MASGKSPSNDYITMFNSPLHYCPACRQYVALDQSRRECASEHGCSPEQLCPMAHLFSARERAEGADKSDDTPASMAHCGAPATKR